ncbi:hypothetical protein SANT12839_004300 [Streptomyces antimycoticus]|uniref:Uncharacterized protein n=1 Tax=Streptomyces antimycoticus TaxID=68175 RepID=A0A4D4JYR6_9ACTN|nr:hypothetical protein SANT12839_004300 [Streptomyces antimycoticus]
MPRSADGPHRGFAAEHDAGAALMGFDLGEDGFDLPAFAVERGQPPGRIASGIQQGSDQPVAVSGTLTALAFELVGQNPDGDRFMPGGAAARPDL